MISLADRPEWQQRALCAQVDTDLFFPGKGDPVRPAKRICGWCEVQAECLRYALDHHIRYGVWGGTSERQRRDMWRAERRDAA